MHLLLHRLWALLSARLAPLAVLAQGDYYLALLRYHVTHTGYLLGLLLLVLLYFSSPEKQRTFRHAVRTLLVLPLISSAGSLYALLLGLFHLESPAATGEPSLLLLENPCSGLLLTLVLFYDYRKRPLQAFLFGLAYSLSQVLLQRITFDGLSSLPQLLLIPLVFGGTCLVICWWDHFYTC